MKRYRSWSIGVPSGRVMPCTRETPGNREDPLWPVCAALENLPDCAYRDRSRSSVPRASSATGENGGQRPHSPRLAGNVLGHILPVVVAGPVSRQRQQTDQGDRARGGENGRRASGRSPCPPAATDEPRSFAWARTVRSGLPTDNACRNQRERHRDHDEHSHRAGDAQSLEIGQPGEAQAKHRSGDRQTGTQDHFGNPAVCGVEGRLPVLAGLTRLVIAPEEEYPVVRSGRDRE